MRYYRSSSLPLILMHALASSAAPETTTRAPGAPYTPSSSLPVEFQDPSRLPVRVTRHFWRSPFTELEYGHGDGWSEEKDARQVTHTRYE